MWRARTLFCLLLPACVMAHWTEQPELPSWAVRGRLQWCLNYGRTDRALVDLFARHGQTLIHGGAYDSPETAAYALERGLRYMPYVCSRTVTTTEIARRPELRDAVLLKPDRSEFLAYNNRVRRYGSLFVPAWPEYVRERTRQVMDKPGAAAIFYDNVYVNDDHREAAVAAWTAWATAHELDPGDDMPSLWDSPQSAAARSFNAEVLVDYYRGLREFCRRHDPPLLISPNLGSLPGYGMAIVEAEAADLVFYETMSHAPFENNTLRYKIGLASSHGRPTGILAYLPERIAAERGEKTWHEGMHHYFYPASPLPEEFALGAAEGAAAGGTYIPCYNLFPSLPVTDLSDPFCRRVHRALEQSYRFITTNQDLFVEGRPGSRVGVLYSSLTTLQGYRTQGLEALAAALSAAGIPYEVLCTEDLEQDATDGIATLIVPNVTHATEATSAGLLRYAETGGRVVLTGSFAEADPLGRPADFESTRRLKAPLRLVSVPIREWRLEGFEPEGVSHVKATTRPARATLPFPGEAGRYRAHIAVTDENDGTSPFRLAVGERVVFEGRLDIEDNQVHWFASPPFDLRPGDSVTLTVEPDAGELGRVAAVVIVGADGERGARLGRGEVVYLPTGLETLPAGELSALLQPEVHLPSPGRLQANVLDAPALGLRSIHLVNYDFRYEVRHEGRYASDDGTAEARTYFSGRPVVLRKILRIPPAEQVVEPVLQVQTMAIAGCRAEMVIQINGREAGRLNVENARGWLELPLDPATLAAENVIEIRAEGDLGQDRWFQIGIDTAAPGGDSFYSEDGGRTFRDDDLSPDLKPQTGEFLIRIQDRRPGGGEPDPTNLARNGGFEEVRVPHSGTTLTVAPAENVTVEVIGGRLLPGLVISPDGPPEPVTPTQADGAAVYTVPRVAIYSVLVLASDRTRLDALAGAQLAAAPWAIPPVTAPLRQKVTDWQPYEDGFEVVRDEARSGRVAVSCANADDQVRGIVQDITFDPPRPGPWVLTAWSRAEDVSGNPDAHYSLYVDAVCADGTVYNGHHTPFATGTHDWQQATLRLTPPAPLRSMRLYLLFRHHTGRVWFDDVTMRAEE